ncbi:MAG: DUF3400 domain-containing protein, partial [Thiotrichaceae bacterium]
EAEAQAQVQATQQAKPTIKILTSCPSCKQGLARYEHETGLEADYLVVEMMAERYGKNWADDVLARFSESGVERVLL